MRVLDNSFYLNEDVIDVAQKLLGKVLVSFVGGHYTSGIIIETEAYKGAEDKASHAYLNKRTPRTEIMFGPGGFSYVYLCYGIHHLFNVVTNKEQIPHAVLIRNVIPIMGIDIMMNRRGKKSLNKMLTGPGTLCQAFGINKDFNGISLQNERLRIEDHDIQIQQKNIISTPRIGIEYSGEDSKLPYRFVTQFN